MHTSLRRKWTRSEGNERKRASKWTDVHWSYFKWQKQAKHTRQKKWQVKQIINKNQNKTKRNMADRHTCTAHNHTQQ